MSLVKYQILEIIDSSHIPMRARNNPNIRFTIQLKGRHGGVIDRCIGYIVILQSEYILFDIYSQLKYAKNKKNGFIDRP